MASTASQNTAYNIQLSACETPGRTHVEGLTPESADRALELLMINSVTYHTLFPAVGFHNKSIDPYYRLDAEPIA
jgi:hypothetical protein